MKLVWATLTFNPAQYYIWFQSFMGGALTNTHTQLEKRAAVHIVRASDGETTCGKFKVSDAHLNPSHQGPRTARSLVTSVEIPGHCVTGPEYNITFDSLCEKCFSLTRSVTLKMRFVGKKQGHNIAVIGCYDLESFKKDGLFTA